jgi:hypothetical protein
LLVGFKRLASIKICFILLPVGPSILSEFLHLLLRHIKHKALGRVGQVDPVAGNDCLVVTDASNATPLHNERGDIAIQERAYSFQALNDLIPALDCSRYESVTK